MRRWARLDAARAQAAGKAPPTHFVEWQGKAVVSVKTGFGTAARLAKLEGNVTPHTLRHTAGTWLMQRGTNLWEAAGYLGISTETLERTYGHHHPDYLRGAADAIARQRRPDQSLVVSLVEERARRAAKSA